MESVEPLSFWTPHLKITAQHVGGIAASFVLFEAFLLYGPARALIKRLLSSNPKLSSKDIESTLPAVTERIVGFVHLVLAVPLAFTVLASSELQADPLYATNTYGQLMVKVSAGYFLYDTIVCFTRDEGLQYIIHGVTCLLAYGYGAYTTWLHYWGAVFLLWELSTPFVYLRWFLYKTGRDDTRLYLYNGLGMIASFALARNVFGSYMSVQFFKTVAAELANPRLNGLSSTTLYSYSIGCFTLNCLNYLWLYKMVRAALHFSNTGKMLEVKRE